MARCSYYINPHQANLYSGKPWNGTGGMPGGNRSESEYLPQVAVQDTQMRLVVRLGGG